MAIRFSSFRTRLLVAILAATAGAQLIAFVLVWHNHRAYAEREMQDQLARAADAFAESVRQKNADLAKGAAALSQEAGLRSAHALTTHEATLRSALESARQRLDAGHVALVSLEGEVVAHVGTREPAAPVHRALHRLADEAESARATGYGVLDGSLHSLAITPLRAPDVVAWVVVGFPINGPYLGGLKRTTGVDATVRVGSRELATTVRGPADFETAIREIPLVDGGVAVVALQYSRDEKLAPARRLERVLGFVFAGSLLVAGALALGIARGFSRPVRQLAAHTRKIAAGDYDTRVVLNRSDELGQLATAFNEMAAGLAERDRVRDLLDKNVSPEIAAQLLRDGAALGGEEREVTVLFADLRGFTTLSEHMEPRALLALLNRYLDRMAGEIEREGGVIDKFVGDAIMALFGAPVSQPDSAARSLRAALAMERSLAAFNRELAAEGAPPLAIGIGINTARVVAGNIGSHRRLNYSVIGDGVNVAARVESLTRNAEYRTSIITTGATRAALPSAHDLTLRPLGTVHVKGRNEPVEIFAVDAPVA